MRGRPERGASAAADRGRRRRLGRLLILLLIPALAGVGGFWMRSSSAFSVDRAVLPVTEHVTEEQLRAALAPASGQNIFRISPDELEDRLKAVPYVREAEVHRRFPHSLEVTLREHQAAARVRLSGGRVWLLAEDGRLLEADRGQAGDSVVIVPPAPLRLKAGQRLPEELQQAVGLARDLEAAGAALPSPARTLALSRAGQATLTLASGVQVRLGELSQLDEKLMVAGQIMDEYSRDGRELAYVDVYLPERPVAKAKAP